MQVQSANPPVPADLARGERGMGEALHCYSTVGLLSVLAKAKTRSEIVCFCEGFAICTVTFGFNSYAIKRFGSIAEERFMLSVFHVVGVHVNQCLVIGGY